MTICSVFTVYVGRILHQTWDPKGHLLLRRSRTCVRQNSAVTAWPPSSKSTALILKDRKLMCKSLTSVSTISKNRLTAGEMFGTVKIFKIRVSDQLSLKKNKKLSNTRPKKCRWSTENGWSLFCFILQVSELTKSQNVLQELSQWLWQSQQLAVSCPKLRTTRNWWCETSGNQAEESESKSESYLSNLFYYCRHKQYVFTIRYAYMTRKKMSYCLN